MMAAVVHGPGPADWSGWRAVPSGPGARPTRSACFSPCGDSRKSVLPMYRPFPPWVSAWRSRMIMWRSPGFRSGGVWSWPGPGRARGGAWARSSRPWMALAASGSGPVAFELGLVARFQGHPCGAPHVLVGQEHDFSLGQGSVRGQFQVRVRGHDVRGLGESRASAGFRLRPGRGPAPPWPGHGPGPRSWPGFRKAVSRPAVRH